MLDPETDLIPQSSPSISSSVSSSDLDTEVQCAYSQSQTLLSTISLYYGIRNIFCNFVLARFVGTFQSTGSFFHDRSTTLGTLMGLNFPSISIRVSSRRENSANATNAGTDTTTTTTTTTTTASTTTSSNVRGGMRKKSKKKVVVIDATADRRKRWWWKLCRDEVETTAASLGEFLQVERRYEERAFYSATEAAAFEFETVLNQQRTENNNGNGNGNGGSSSLFADGKVLPPPYTEVVGRPSVDGGGVRRFPVLLTGICSGGGTSD